MRDTLADAIGVMAGLLAALALWAAILGARVEAHAPGLWTLRFERILACGLDYNGPPYRDGIRLWLTCGDARG